MNKIEIKKWQPPKVDTHAKRLAKRWTIRQKLAILGQYERQMSLIVDREHILESLAKKLIVTPRQVERIIAQAKEYREKTKQHLQELSVALSTIASNFETYLKDIGPASESIGYFVYGEDDSIRYGMGMRKVDKSAALNAIYHLKGEFPELSEVRDWADLIPGDTMKDDLIIRLQLKAHQGKFSGKCPECAR